MTLERAPLLSPGTVARAAARMAQTPEKRWMLAQADDVRASYVREVLDTAQGRFTNRE
jgi:hypothetical protein